MNSQFPGGLDLSPAGPMRSTTAWKTAVWATLTLWCGAVISEAITTQLELGLIDSAGDDLVDAGAYNDLARALTVGDYCATALVTATLIGWLLRARANALVIDGGGQRWRKSWLVLGWVVPIAGFFVPRQVVEDIWTASKPLPHGRKAGRPLLVSAWWLTWMLYCLLGTLAYRDVGASGDPASLRDAASLTSFLAALGVLAAVLLALIVDKISHFQDTQTARITAALA